MKQWHNRAKSVHFPSVQRTFTDVAKKRKWNYFIGALQVQAVIKLKTDTEGLSQCQHCISLFCELHLHPYTSHSTWSPRMSSWLSLHCGTVRPAWWKGKGCRSEHIWALPWLTDITSSHHSYRDFQWVNLFAGFTVEMMAEGLSSKYTVLKPKYSNVNKPQPPAPLQY